MFLQHNCISVKDLDRSVKFYTEVMGFMLLTPPEHIAMGRKRVEGAPDTDFSYYQEDCGVQCFRQEDCEAQMAVVLIDPTAPAGGGCIEIQCFNKPKATAIEETYITTGIKEICFHVDTAEEVYAWAEKLKKAGVDMRTDVWIIGDGANQHSTVLFHDPDGIILQIAN